MRLGKFLQNVNVKMAKFSGTTMTIVRYVDNSDGGARIRQTHTAKGKRQPLTPTFAHNIVSEPDDENINENDQCDFVFPGDTDIRDNDLIIYKGHLWAVTTTQEQSFKDDDTSIHCLCHKRGKVENEADV